MPDDAVSLLGAAAAFGMDTLSVIATSWAFFGGEAIVVAVSEHFYTAPVAPEKKPVLVIWQELRRVRC